MYNSDYSYKQARPAVSLTFSRNALLMLLGYATHPSVQTNKAHATWEQA